MTGSEPASELRAKYAVGEHERRFLLDEIPAGATNPRHITDHYVDGTRLRLRAVRDGARSTGAVDLKLGHKRRIVADDPTAILHTSMYLDAAEFDVLATLPGRRLVKTRWSVPVGPDADPSSPSGSVNVFEEDLAGLILLEVDLGSQALLEAFTPPSWVGPEVTADEAFTGGALAGASFADIAPLAAAAAATKGACRSA
ncbi:MAG: hypothetical protein ACR2QO_05580 [Acidimicrobiales bacterium]